MKEKLVAICSLTVLLCVWVLSGCAGEKTEIHIGSTTISQKHQKVEHIGQAPDALEKVIENNVFKDIVAFDGVLMKTEI